VGDGIPNGSIGVGITTSRSWSLLWDMGLDEMYTDAICRDGWGRGRGDKPTESLVALSV
jgi:hypothetical protein